MRPCCWSGDAAPCLIATTQEDKKETTKVTFLPKPNIGLHQVIESAQQDPSVGHPGGEPQKGLVVKVVLHHHFDVSRRTFRLVTCVRKMRPFSHPVKDEMGWNGSAVSRREANVQVEPQEAARAAPPTAEGASSW